MGAEQQRAERFAKDLVGVLGNTVVSVVLYGSAARGQFQEGVSDLNILVLARKVGIDELRSASRLARKWVSDGNRPPMILPQDEWRRSADVFPIELADIQSAHRVLHGEDPFVGIQIHPGYLRLQCEHELKGKQIQLRERLLLSAEEPAELGELLRSSISTFLVLFRTVLRLTGSEVPAEAEGVIEETARRVGFEPEPLCRIYRSRREKGKFRPTADDPLVAGYLQAIAETVRFVDALPDSGDARLDSASG